MKHFETRSKIDLKTIRSRCYATSPRAFQHAAQELIQSNFEKAELAAFGFAQAETTVAAGSINESGKLTIKDFIELKKELDFVNYVDDINLRIVKSFAIPKHLLIGTPTDGPRIERDPYEHSRPWAYFYMPMQVVRPDMIMTSVPFGRFTVADWQSYPRKLKKRIKKAMIAMNKIIDKYEGA